MASMIFIEQFIRGIRLAGGIKTNKPAFFGSTVEIDGAVQFDGAVTFAGGANSGASVVTGDTVLAAANAGKMYVDTKGSATTTFSLPTAAVAGQKFTFVCGDASGEILINPVTGQKIVGKTHGAENATGIANTTTGIKNTAATNVKGDFCTLTSDGVDTWWMTSVAGVWASQ